MATEHPSDTYHSAPSSRDDRSDIAAPGAAEEKSIRNKAREQIRRAGEKVREETTRRTKSLFYIQKEKAAEGLGEVAQAFREAGENLKEHDREAIAHYAESAADKAAQYSDYLHDKDIGYFLRRVEGFARSHPAAFLGSAFFMGVILARFIKSSSTQSREYGYEEERYSFSEGMTSDFPQQTAREEEGFHERH